MFTCDELIFNNVNERGWIDIVRYNRTVIVLSFIDSND